MKGNGEGSESADSRARRAHGKRRDMTRMYRRSGGIAVLVAAAALALAACSGSADSPQVASLGKSSGSSPGKSGGGGNGGGGTTTAAPKGNATKLVDEWASCERSHGDPNQADPIINIHDVINITLPAPGQGGVPAGDPHNGTGTCSQYLTAAQIALRKADPVQDPGGVTSQAEIVNFANCMRSNGVPNYPYPSGPNDSQTNFNGTGVDPNSPHVVKVNDLCGEKLGLPTWWINGWGPPGDISVISAGLNPNGSPPNRSRANGHGGAPVPASGASSGSGASG